MRAAVLREFGAPLDVVDHLETVATGAGQVKVRIRATGLCHSDLSAMNGLLGLPSPFVPGHEGAGEIIEVGEGVTMVAPGDRVIVNFMPPCGACVDCANGEGNMCMSIARGASATPNFRDGGNPVFGLLGCGTFAEEVVLPQQSVVKVADDVPFDIAALIGCGVTTGVGAALNTAQVKKGSTVAVVGCGGVGIAAIMGARLAGAEQIVAIDPSAAKRELVGRYGATAAVSPEEAEDKMTELTGGRGFDYTFEVVGRSVTARTAYDLVRRGGTMTVVGIGGPEETLPLSMRAFAGSGKRVLASAYGGTDVPSFMDQLVGLWRDGRLDLASMITGRASLDDVNKGFDLMRTGDAVRTVIEL
ncbi:alcohol dehydrogenase catalytic domain-containing protein [Streptomyces sp. NPDC051920]|uniref:alcohol dehydrogenase catalytic domain-containing protein n=1 Tax=Streptomyces sp. NPDC051920 TaxID=3155523 RepID=UPI0034377952